MAIKRLSYESLTEGAVEDGHAKDLPEAREKILNNILDSFLEKCVREKVSLDNLESSTIVGYSTKYDCFFVRFREVFFEVYFNEDLLFNDLDPHVFSHVKMPEKIDELKKICIKRRPDVPLKVNYFKPLGRKYMN